jgi:trans-aconitate methyltransferase
MKAWNATLYEENHSFVWKEAASLVELLAPQRGEHILDLGCGTGQLTAQIAGQGASVVGIDLDRAMIDQARQNFPQLQFTVADARDFSFPSPFDAVFSNAVLHWIKEPDRVLACVHGALKPGGRFVAEFGGKGNVQAIARALQKALHGLGHGDLEMPWFFPSIGDYVRLLENHGFEVTFAHLFPRPTPLEGEAGLRRWIEMFASQVVDRLMPEQKEDFFLRVEKELRPLLHTGETWIADYRRLRIQAWRI